MSKHLEGPWLFRPSGESVYTAPEPGTCYKYGEFIFGFHPVSGPSDEVLALVLAAPKMLAALKAMITAYEHEASAENPALLMAKAAVFEATGEHHEE